MTEREFMIQIWRGLSFMANDPSCGREQRRGLLMMIDAIERRYELRAPAETKPVTAKTRQRRSDVLQSVT